MLCFYGVGMRVCSGGLQARECCVASLNQLDHTPCGGEVSA
jgi:hypothetical protein